MCSTINRKNISHTMITLWLTIIVRSFIRLFQDVFPNSVLVANVSCYEIILERHQLIKRPLVSRPAAVIVVDKILLLRRLLRAVRGSHNRPAEPHRLPVQLPAVPVHLRRSNISQKYFRCKVRCGKIPCWQVQCALYRDAFVCYRTLVGLPHCQVSYALHHFFFVRHV